MDDYVSKPIHAEALFAAIERLVPPREPEPAAGAGETPVAASTERADEPPLDRTKLLERMGGDEALLREIIGLFIEEAPPLLGAARQAVAQSDAAALQRAAHTLKGCVGNFGAQKAYDAARHLEQIGKGGVLTAAPEAFDALAQALQSLTVQLSRELAPAPSQARGGVAVAPGKAVGAEGMDLAPPVANAASGVEPEAAGPAHRVLGEPASPTAAAPLREEAGRRGEAPSPPDVNAVLDREELLQRVGGDRELLTELVVMFRDSVAGQLTALQEAVANQDCRAVERIAHSIKGSVGNFAARSAFATALRLEKMGRETDLAGAEAAVRELEAEIERLKQALATMAG
jgi:HPt (histidine-containing phosphotransfer) domain-containing protein